MNPLLTALALVGCWIALIAGTVMARSVPLGAQRLLTVDEAAEPRERSLVVRLRRTFGRRFAGPVLAAIPAKQIALTRHRLDAAGRSPGTTMEDYGAVKATSVLLFGGVGLLLTIILGSPVLFLAFSALGWLQIDLALAAQVKRRQRQIDRDLPDLLDVLTITVGAGLGFRTALGRVGEALGGPLGQEIRLAMQQMGYGAARRAALEGIRERNDSEALGQFITALLQAEELGAPLSATLQDIAVDMRNSFAQRARRDAARAVPRVSLVVTTLIVPAIGTLLLVGLFISSGLDLGEFGG